MIGVIAGGIAVAVVLNLYCCICAGARADRKMEKLCRKGKQDADGESG